MISGHLRNLHVLTVHNYGISSEQVSAVGAELDRLSGVCLRQPNRGFGVFIGDFNFSARDDRVFKVGRPLLESSAAAVCSSGTRQASWERFLSGWTEVCQPFPTHYNKASNT